jgi:hypothetical protein
VRGGSCGLPSGENCSPYDFRDLRDDGVSEGVTEQWLVGNPMSHARKLWLSGPRIAFLPCDCRPERRVAVGVGHNIEPLTEMGRPNVGSSKHVPFRIIPEAIKFPEDAVQSETAKAVGIFKDDVRPMGQHFFEDSKDFKDKTGLLTIDTQGALLGFAHVSAGKACRDDVNQVHHGRPEIFEADPAHIAEVHDARPTGSEDASAELVGFGKGDRLEAARSFQPEAKAANAAEQVQQTVRLADTSDCLCVVPGGVM